MRHRSARLGLAVTAILVGGIASACAGSSPTPKVILVTTKPTPETIYVYVTPTPEFTESQSAGPSSTATAATSDTAAASSTAAPTQTPTATPTPTPTPTPFPVVTPPPGSTCFRTASNDGWFHAAAAGLQSYGDTWTVYCAAVLPSTWSIRTSPLGASVEYNNGGQLTVVYVGPGGKSLSVAEGSFCAGAGCLSFDTDLGPAAFGDLSGHLYTKSGGFLLAVDPGTGHAYQVTGTGMTEQDFRNYAACFIPVMP
jgi:hypothetical protein